MSKTVLLMTLMGFCGGFIIAILLLGHLNYQIDFFFWASVVTTIFSVAISVVAIWQYFEAEAQKIRTKAQVKIWMQDAKGIVAALRKIQTATYSSISDVLNSISILETTSAALFQSLYEERVIDEQSYMTLEQEKAALIAHQEIQSLKNQTPSAQENVYISSKSPQKKSDDSSKEAAKVNLIKRAVKRLPRLS